MKAEKRTDVWGSETCHVGPKPRELCNFAGAMRVCTGRNWETSGTCGAANRIE